MDNPIKKIFFLHEKAFNTIAFSACETFKKECCGVLIGNRSKAIIKEAFAYQEVQRYPSSVDYEINKDKKVNQIIENIGESIGEFHSHTYVDKSEKRKCSPSKTDIKEMKTGNIEIITAIWKKTNTFKLKISNGYIFGTFGKYRIKMACYLKMGERRYIRCLLDLYKKGI